MQCLRPKSGAARALKITLSSHELCFLAKGSDTASGLVPTYWRGLGYKMALNSHLVLKREARTHLLLNMLYRLWK